MRGDDIDLDRSVRRRFPALDAELSAARMARRRLRNAALVTAVVVVLAGLGGLIASLTSGTAAPGGAAHRAAPAPVKTLPATSAPAGSVLSETQHGALALSGLGGHPAKVLMSLPSQVYVSSTLDARYFVTTNGQLLSLANGHLTATRLRNVGPAGWNAGGPEPLADHDKYLAVQNFNNPGSEADGSPIMIRSLATQKGQSLGTGDQLSGDPAAPGVIISLPAPIVATSAPTTAGANGMWPDGKVVIRDAGRKDVLLGTAAQFNADAGLPAKTPDYLFPVPDPAGDKIAVLVEPQTGRLPSGVVVVSRSGHKLYALGRAGHYVGAAWSLSGQSLAMPALAGSRSVLHLWTAGGDTSAQPFPGRSDYSGCSWSPDGRWILCEVSGPHASGGQWAVASAAGGPMVITKGPGYPVAWLPAGSAG